MAKRKQTEPNKPRELSEQSKLFIEKAREIGADDEADAAEVMRRLVAQKKQTAGTRSKKG